MPFVEWKNNRKKNCKLKYEEFSVWCIFLRISDSILTYIQCIYIDKENVKYCLTALENAKNNKICINKIFPIKINKSIKFSEFL